MKSSAVILALLATACTPISDLVATIPELAGANCAHGGTAIQEGADDNADGVLQDTEIDSVHYVCEAAPATTELVSVTPEPEGPNCETGGNLVRTGTDVDRDGVLDENEVRATAYVCNGPPDVEQLVVTRPEPNGEHCITGGTAILVGTDADADGVLSENEVTGTSYVCDGTFDGTTILSFYVIRNSLDAALIANIVEITGALRVQPLPGAMGFLSLPALQRVGMLFIHADEIDVSLPALRTVDGDAELGLSFASTASQTWEIPQLESVGGNLAVRGGLETFDAPALQSVGGNFGFYGTSNLQSVSTASLSSVGGIASFNGLTVVTQISLPVLSSLGGIEFWGCRQLPLSGLVIPPVEELPLKLAVSDVPWTSLGSMSSVTQTAELTLVYASQLSSIVLPDLTSVGLLKLYGNSIQSFSAPALESVTGPVEINAPQLPACQITNVLDAIGYQGTRSIVAGPC